MASKTKPTSGTSDNNRTQIILAIIGLISTLAVAYFGYRQVIDPLHISASLTQTSQSETVLDFPTNTSTPVTTETVTPTPKPSATLTKEATLTPIPLITEKCFSSETWDYTPRKTIPTDGCWIVKEFSPIDNGVQIGLITETDSGEQQRGFFAPLDGNVDIQFIVNIKKFESQKISPDKTKTSNLAFGIVEGLPFNYYNGIYVYYYVSKPNAASYDSQVAKEQDVSYNGELNVDRNQTIRFQIRGKQLTVYIDGIAVDVYTLTFNQNALYFGYRLFENTELNASITNLTITP